MNPPRNFFFTVLSLFVFAFFGLQHGYSGQGEVIIDTTFADSPGGELVTSPSQVFPYQWPSSISFSRTGNTTVQGLETSEGGILPPAALIEMRGDEEGKLGSANLRWDLRNMGLLEGRYELTYTISSLAEEVSGGRMRVEFGAADGSELPRDPAPHPNQMPCQVNFAKNGSLWFSQFGPRVSTHQPVEVKVTFDLGERVWSVAIDGHEDMTDKPFHPRFADKTIPLEITGLRFGSLMETDGAEAGFVLGPVKLVRLPAE